MSSEQLTRFRGVLAQRLARLERGSLYDALGVTADADDAAINGAIAALREREATGETLATETRLAIETLGQPASREAYDRKLFAQLDAPRPDTPQTTRPASSARSLADAPEVTGSWWNSGKTSLLVGLVVVAAVAVVGGLYLSFFQEQTRSELVQGVIHTQQQAVTADGATEAYRATTERMAVENSAEHRAAQREQAAEAERRRLDLAEQQEMRRRQEAEDRMAIAEEALQAQQQQAAWAREQREQRQAQMAQERQRQEIRREELQRQLGVR